MMSYMTYAQTPEWPAMNEDLRKIASAVDEKVSEISQSSHFLTDMRPQTDIPLFDRREIHALEVLGTGGFSQVRLISNFCLHPDSNRAKRDLVGYAEQGRSQYALKHLRDEIVKNKDDFESAAIDLSIEVQFLTRLNHPNIVKVRGLAKDGIQSLSRSHDSFFIIMDRLEPLDARIHRWKNRLYHFPDYRPVSLARKLHYASQIADAIAYLHDNAIIYRDLKPGNVGFNMHDTVQLFDFGLSREIPRGGSSGKDETFLMSGVGTRRYMAPEIVNSNCYNEKVDVYAWAMTTLEMLSLEKPFPSYSSEQHAEMVCKCAGRPVLSPYDIPMVLIHLLEKSWAQDIKQRLHMKDVCQQLRPLLGRSDDELFQMSVNLVTTSSSHSSKTSPSVCKETSNVYFEFPPHFQQLVQDCEILSEYSDMDSCMDLTLTTTASTTWQDSVSTFF